MKLNIFPCQEEQEEQGCTRSVPGRNPFTRKESAPMNSVKMEERQKEGEGQLSRDDGLVSGGNARRPGISSLPLRSPSSSSPPPWDQNSTGGFHDLRCPPPPLASSPPPPPPPPPLLGMVKTSHNSHVHRAFSPPLYFPPFPSAVVSLGLQTFPSRSLQSRIRAPPEP
ncbi:hypothetical protein Mp_7g03330 [Marchantia polymorpha subsp. ruderalis]|uniref:Uncharacterized protein n=2 Tax=Marchantia polymorpha TaxID=3197 RepID=A0AAF6BVQ1_MARPO|nr:hypothetical protein MARPO_0074s0063 [Marchantia polymorpha]BBN16085.1 hypothetical protein Mp_7g03330 [Marchantia polymorpha subsp. ruderalis]|eukprot:PTQ35080.1 hypothetical protein MARPO_0074s0063 [Marchantia polymorpha]